VAIVPGGVADRLAVIRKRIGRFDRRGEGAVLHQVGELAVGIDDICSPATTSGPAPTRSAAPIGVVYYYAKHQELRLGQPLTITKTNLGAYADKF
jgi:hypothetical protein